jgi:hypothetical protein
VGGLGLTSCETSRVFAFGSTDPIVIITCSGVVGMLGTLDGEIRWQFELCFKTHIPGKNQPNIMKSSGSLGEALAVGVLFGIVLLLVVTPIIYSGFKKRQRHRSCPEYPSG